MPGCKTLLNPMWKTIFNSFPFTFQKYLKRWFRGAEPSPDKKGKRWTVLVYHYERKQVEAYFHIFNYFLLLHFCVASCNSVLHRVLVKKFLVYLSFSILMSSWKRKKNVLVLSLSFEVEIHCNSVEISPHPPLWIWFCYSPWLNNKIVSCFKVNTLHTLHVFYSS